MAGPDFSNMIPFAGMLGIEISSATADEVRGSLAWRQELCTSFDVMHGGVLMSFADTLGAVCASLNLPEGAATTTIESKTNFLRAVREGFVHGTSKPLHAGRTIIVVQTNLRNDEGKLVGQTTQTQAVLAPR